MLRSVKNYLTYTFTESSINARWQLWLPALIASLYPVLLNTFHSLIIKNGHMTVPSMVLLAGTFVVPAFGLYHASKLKGVSPLQIRARRLGLLLVAVPTMYCFFGVVLFMLGSNVPDVWIWTPLWLAIALFISIRSVSSTEQTTNNTYHPALRVAHGVVGLVATIFISFHLFNHMFSLLGESAHAHIMDLGRHIYRSSFIEPIVVLAMLFQATTGLILAWKFSAHKCDFPRLFQVTTGIYMSIFILGHLNSVFIYARTFAGIKTDWNFATGDPIGMINDPWSIRLLPHYALGVFFVLAHLASGLRGILIAHGVNKQNANLTLAILSMGAALVALAIMLGLTGTRIH
jgi:hypothetical protein